MKLFNLIDKFWIYLEKFHMAIGQLCSFYLIFENNDLIWLELNSCRMVDNRNLMWLLLVPVLQYLYANGVFIRILPVSITDFEIYLT